MVSHYLLRSQGYHLQIFSLLVGNAVENFTDKRSHIFRYAIYLLFFKWMV